MELTNKKQSIEKRNSERRAIQDAKRQAEIEFLKYQGGHLETFLKTLEQNAK